jgi:hypothetical protein
LILAIATQLFSPPVASLLAHKPWTNNTTCNHGLALYHSTEDLGNYFKVLMKRTSFTLDLRQEIA